MELEDFVDWMEALDEETHEHGGDTNCRGISYDVDYVNPRRVLTGKEAADLYEGLEETLGINLALDGDSLIVRD